MGDSMTIIGIVGTDPVAKTTAAGTPMATFRLASPIRRQDRETGAWSEVGQNWYTVTAWRALARNVQQSIRKGERVIVAGELKVRPYERPDGSSGTAVDLDARAVGHDLAFQTTTAVRVLPQRPEPARQASEAPEAPAGPQPDLAALAEAPF